MRVDRDLPEALPGAHEGRRRVDLNIVIDRSPKEAVVAVGACTLAFLLVLPLYMPDVTQVSHALFGGLIGAALITVGFAAASRCRPMPQRTSTQRRRLATLTLALGAALGIANLGTNFALAAMHPRIHTLLVERFSGLSPWGSMLAAPVIEEIALRLFFLSTVAWVAARFVKQPDTVFLVALLTSAFVFGLMHIVRPVPDSRNLAFIYLSGVALKSGAASLLLGWIYWRWGLPYAIASHSIANAAHRLFAPILF